MQNPVMVPVIQSVFSWVVNALMYGMNQIKLHSLGVPRSLLFSLIIRVLWKIGEWNKIKSLY